MGGREQDGFIHLSTAPQVSTTLSRFFGSDEMVTLLKVDCERLSGFKVVKWEPSGSGESPFLSPFPYLTFPSLHFPSFYFS